MSSVVRYRGYVGSVEFSEEDCLFYGKVLGIRGLISYEGSSAKELLEGFHGAVDEYLSVCNAEEIEPEKPYEGSFNVRIEPELHQQAALCAMAMKISLNSFVESAIRKSVEAYE